MKKMYSCKVVTRSRSYLDYSAYGLVAIALSLFFLLFPIVYDFLVYRNLHSHIVHGYGLPW